MASEHRARGRLTGRSLLVVLVVLMLLSPLGDAAARRVLQAGGGGSPAVGRSQVTTQGIADLPDGQIIYRVVRRTAPARGKAKVGRRVLSIVLATDDPVLLSNERADGTIEDVARIAPGESYLVQSGTRQIRSGLGGQAVDYLAVEIVPAANGPDIGNGELLFQSDPFTAPDGPRDIDFVRNVLEGKDTGLIPDSGSSVAILATDGAIDILPASGKRRTLQAGESAIFPAGDLEITPATPTANGVPINQLAGLTSSLQTGTTEAAYVAAVIGEEVPPTQPRTSRTSPTAASNPNPNPNPNPPVYPRPEPSETPAASPTPEATGSVVVGALLCPNPPASDAISPDPTCVATTEYAVTLTGGGATRTLADAVADSSGNVFTFSDLPLGNYTLTMGTMPTGAVGYSLLSSSGNVAGSASAGFTITLDEATSQATIPILFYMSAAPPPPPVVLVTVNVTLSECGGYDPTAGPTDCAPVPQGAVTQPYLHNAVTGVVANVSTATVSGNVYTWMLPAGGGAWLVLTSQPYDLVINGTLYKQGDYGIGLSELPFNLDVYAIRPPVVV